MNLTKEELKKKFDIAIMQRFTIDRNKCEAFGDLLQGFLAVKKEDNCRIIPFTLKNDEELIQLEKKVLELETDYLGISFVQHYIHYT